MDPITFKTILTNQIIDNGVPKEEAEKIVNDYIDNFLNKWHLFQRAWSLELQEKKKMGEEVPIFGKLGERTNACSAAYKEFKTKTEFEQNTYLLSWSRMLSWSRC